MKKRSNGENIYIWKRMDKKGDLKKFYVIIFGEFLIDINEGNWMGYFLCDIYLYGNFL